MKEKKQIPKKCKYCQKWFTDEYETDICNPCVAETKELIK